MNDLTNCLSCQAGYQFVDGGYSDCTGTCMPVDDGAAHFIAGSNLNNMNGANQEYGQGGGSFTSSAVWTLAKVRNTPSWPKSWANSSLF